MIDQIDLAVERSENEPENLLIMADKQVFILDGYQPDQKKTFAQWFDEGPKGPLGLLNKLRCEDNFDVPKDTLEAGGKEFIYYSK